ncbi:hypothetical protein [Flammeovirga sp. OC4]|uniref:hypothetical protein n=1 Tax=Flammeovirga sp. OC4 TaxID=1382345 RepID=UPI0005C7377D|nr:hypothetical protein [Flammeovirga sp. OC4]
MPTDSGKKYRTRVSEDDGTNWLTIGYTTEDNINVTPEYDDTETKDSNEQTLTGVPFSLDLSAMQFTDVNANLTGKEKLFELMIADTRIKIQQGVFEDGEKIWEGYGKVGELSETNNVSSKSENSFTLNGEKDTLTRVTYSAT